MELMILAGIAVLALIWVVWRGAWLPESPIADWRSTLEGSTARGRVPGTQDEELTRPWGRNSDEQSEPPRP